MTRHSCADAPLGSVTVPGKVVFVGAGPGAPDLITVRGQAVICRAACILYAGSLVPPALFQQAPLQAPAEKIIDSAPLTLAETHAICRETALAGGMVARVHTGDPSLYGAVQEQAALLNADGIEWEVVPGVSAAFAAAAAAGVSFTVPECTQSLIITRLAGRTPVPERERLAALASHGTSLAIYLSAHDGERLQEALSALDPETAVVCAYRVGWPEERIVRTTVGRLSETVRQHALTRQTVFLVLPGEAAAASALSRLYDAGFSHGYRNSQS